MFCKHNYSILKIVDIKNPLADSIIGADKIEVSGPILNRLKRKVVIVYKCSKCNKIKESVFIN